MEALCWPTIKFALMDPDAAADWPIVAGSATDTANTPDAGKPQPVLEFYDQFREPAYRYLLSLRLDPETAEDLVHETFLRLHRALGEQKIRTDSVRAWVFRVAHNLAVSLRRKSGEVSVSTDELILLADGRQSTGNPETAVLHEEWLLRVRQAVHALPSQQQQCLHMRAEGLRYREIAEVMGTSISTVAAHLQRAMERLIEECGE